MDTLIRKVMMDCPLCDRQHEVEEKTRLVTAVVKGEKVEFDEHFFVCKNVDKDENEFESGTMLNANLLNARNAYRKKHGLLTSDEIVGIRSEYGLSQVDLARLLGWGEATISRYESKAIQDEPYDDLLRFIKDDPSLALDFLKKNSDKFPMEKRMAIYRAILAKMEKEGKEYISRKALESDYACFMDLTDDNGFTLLNIDKIEAAVSYIAKKVSALFKVKLMKLLWYADCLSFIMNGSTITGLVYIHEKMGALPIGHKNLMNLHRLNVVEEESSKYESMFHIYPTENMDYSVLSESEKKVLDRVIKKFKDFDTKQIVKYMHEEKAYKETKDGEVIPFSLAKEIREF